VLRPLHCGPVQPLLQFFALTYAVTWTCFFTAAVLSSSIGSFVPAAAALQMPLLMAGTFAPSLVALGITARDDGVRGIRALVRRVLDSSAAARWYVFAIGYMAAIKLLVAAVYRLGTGSWPPFGSEPWYVIAAAIVISTPVQAGEEIGWRGYALPRLAAYVGFARASLVLGLIWACWHLPLFFVPGIGNYGQSFLVFVVGGIALSVAMTWLYVNTRGSVLLAMLMHSAVNQTMSIVPTRLANPGSPFALDTSLVTWIFGAVLWMTAAYFLARMRHIEFTASQTQPPKWATIGPSF
jgi:membrane protease YdiL (CAAX protease family)